MMRRLKARVPSACDVLVTADDDCARQRIDREAPPANSSTHARPRSRASSPTPSSRRDHHVAVGAGAAVADPHRGGVRVGCGQADSCRKPRNVEPLRDATQNEPRRRRQRARVSGRGCALVDRVLGGTNSSRSSGSSLRSRSIRVVAAARRSSARSTTASCSRRSSERPSSSRPETVGAELPKNSLRAVELLGRLVRCRTPTPRFLNKLPIGRAFRPRRYCP